MQIRMKDQLTADEALMQLEVANDEVDSLRQQLDDAHQIIAHQAKLNEAAWENIGVLREALQSIVDCCDEDHAARDYSSRQTEIRSIARSALAQGGSMTTKTDEPIVSLSYERADDGTYTARMIVIGLTNEEMAKSAVEHMRRLFCGESVETAQ